MIVIAWRRGLRVRGMSSPGQILARHPLTWKRGTTNAFADNDLEVRPFAGLTEGWITMEITEHERVLLVNSLIQTISELYEHDGDKDRAALGALLTRMTAAY
jgi:hypothetical protein